MNISKNNFFLSIVFFIGLMHFSISYSMNTVIGLFKKVFSSTFECPQTMSNLRIQSGDEVVSLVKDFLEKEKFEIEKKFPVQIIKIGNNEVNAQIVKYKGKDIVQLKVLNQMTKKGGGGASCGYQTIKNSILAVLSIAKKDIPESVKKLALPIELQQKEKNILTTKLNDVGLVEQFFGNVHGKWRRGVIADRIVERLKIITKKNIKLHLKNPNVSRNLKLNNKVVKQFYSQLLDDYVNKKLGPAVKGEKIFSINIDNIQKYSKDICEKKSANDIEKYSLKTTINKKQLTEILSSKEMIQDYINVENLQKITILPNNYLHRIENHEKMLKKTKSIGLGARKSDGDWLDAEEMRKIIKNECDHGMLADVKDCTYIVYDDLAVIGKEYDSNCSLILETAKKTIKNPNHKVVFCIGTMSQEKASSGHWFPLVWTSNRCFTMDSLDNKIRLEDKSVKTIFDKFEHSKLCYKAGSVLARNSCLGPCFLNKRSFAMAPLVYLMNKSKFSKKEFSLI